MGGIGILRFGRLCPHSVMWCLWREHNVLRIARGLLFDWVKGRVSDSCFFFFNFWKSWIYLVFYGFKVYNFIFNFWKIMDLFGVLGICGCGCGWVPVEHVSLTVSRFLELSPLRAFSHRLPSSKLNNQ